MKNYYKEITSTGGNALNTEAFNANTEAKKQEEIITPAHYSNGKDYDLIDVIADYGLNFNRGNIIKYVCRAGKKEDELKDLLKAKDYLEREIKKLKEEIK